MATREPMTCAECGARMNFHAEKVDYAAALDAVDAAPPELGGLVEQIHACPECGATAARPAPNP